MAKRISILVFLLTAMMARSENMENVTLEPATYLFEGDNIIDDPYNKFKCINSHTCKADHHGIPNSHLEEINEMLKTWKVKINEQGKTTKRKILVIGNSGTGISTFVQFLAGDNSKLISEEVVNNTGQFVIKDNNKIGSLDKGYRTLYPEEVLLDEDTSLCDIPGFSDIRNPKDEIFVSYSKYIYFAPIYYQNVKVILLTEYSSVNSGASKQNFISLLKRLMNNFSVLESSSITLIAVNVPNMYQTKLSNIELISNESIISTIAYFLENTKLFLKDSLKRIINCNEHYKFIKAINIIENLLETDDTGSYKKINIFRQPTEPGVLIDMQTLQENKKSLLKTILNNTEFRYSSPSYTESEIIKEFKTCIDKSVDQNIKSTLDELKISFLSSISYESYDQNYDQIFLLNKQVKNMLELKYHF